MKRRVWLQRRAEHDLSNLITYLEDRSPAAAVSAADTIRSAVLALADFPEQGRPGTGGRRELVVGFGRDGYVVQYRVRPREVVVVRIFHGRQQR